MCNNPNWEPIEFAEHGDMNTMAGISIDTIHKIEKQLQIKISNYSNKVMESITKIFKRKKM